MRFFLPGADRFERLQITATHEDAHAAKERALIVGQEIITTLHGVAERAVLWRQIMCAIDEQIERARMQVRQNLVR